MPVTGKWRRRARGHYRAGTRGARLQGAARGATGAWRRRADAERAAVPVPIGISIAPASSNEFIELSTPTVDLFENSD